MASSPTPSSPLNPHRSASASPSPSLARRPSNPSSVLHAIAAQARAVENREDTLELEGLISPEERLKFFRCLDSDLLPPLASTAQRTQALGALETVLLLLTNALEKGLVSPLEPKYLQIKLSNPAIRKKLLLDDEELLHGKGSAMLDWLHLCGWRPTVKDFQEYYVFPHQPSPKRMAELQTGTEILRHRLEKEQTHAAASAERQKLAQEEEGKRKEIAMLRFKEDRLAKMDRDERERELRAARAAVELQQQDVDMETSPLPA